MIGLKYAKSCQRETIQKEDVFRKGNLKCHSVDMVAHVEHNNKRAHFQRFSAEPLSVYSRQDPPESV
jgi:hypothetical protein